MATKKTEIIVPASTEMAFGNEAPDWARNGTGRGSENVTAKDMVLPRLEIVQAQSPIKELDEDIKEGMMFNTVTMQVVGESAYVIPVFYRMEFLIWKDQDSGGGFFGAFNSRSDAEIHVQEVVSQGENPDLLEIVDTPVHYCALIHQDMTHEQIVISMPKSKAKVSRKWNATIQIAGGDRFSRVYKITTFKDKNKQNKMFFNYIVQPAGFPPEPLFHKMEALYGMFKEHGVTANHETATAGGEQPSEI